MDSQPLNSDDWMTAELQRLDAQNRRRTLRHARMLPGGRIRLDGWEMLNLCSNDYLGLADQIASPAATGGAGGSRLICGNHPEIQELERFLAELHDTEACLVFGSGFLANVGCLSALMGRGDVIFSDKLNHASIVDGAQLSRAECVRYRHLDMDHLAALLEKHKGARRKLIVTDSIFSMDGDTAPLAEIVELKQTHNAMLMVDEAHSGGVTGPRGAGLTAELGLAKQVDVHMGTLSKAFACYGAYVCGSQTLVDYLINTARSFIYSTGLPQSLAVAALDSATRVIAASDRRQRLRENAEFFRDGLQKIGLDTGPSNTQIVPLMLGSDERAVRVSESLRRMGVAAVAIRPPTVPENSARIRFSLMATHSRQDLERALATIGQVISDEQREST